MGPQQNNAEKQIINNPEKGINFTNPNAETMNDNAELARGNVEVLTSNIDTINQQVNDALSTTNTVTSAIPATLPSLSSVPVSQPKTSTVANPQSADDVDLIEKEWVDRAKKIISETQNEPYLRDKKVTELREDYKHKRYSQSSDVSGVA